MRIRRMTITLPPRLRPQAGSEARRIAEEAVRHLGNGSPASVRITVDGNGTSGHALAQTVGRGLANRSKGGV